MGRQSVQSKKCEDEEDDRDDEEENEDEREEDEEDDRGSFKSKSDADDDEDEDDEEGDDLDSALADRGGKPSIFIEPWRKKGAANIWLHPKTKFAKCGHHKWFRIVSFTKKRTQEEVSFIRFERFNCHEPADFVSISKDRDDELRREHRAQICPFCKMLEWVEDRVLSGELSPDAEVFRFDDGDPEHLQVLHAAGISGLITNDDFPEKFKKICKRSKVLQRDPWSENCSLKMSHAFQVVDDNDPTEVKWAFEPPDLFFNLKDAIAKEKKRNGDDDGDPMKNPYALLWEFDEDKAKKNYGKGASVVPQPKRKMTSKVRRLLEGPKRTDQGEVIGPGNLLELRASMENAAQIDMPFDEFFKAAKKAGLMEGQASSKTSSKKRDAKDDEPESDPKPKTSSKPAPVQAKGKPKEEEPEEDEDDDDDPEFVNTCDFCGEQIGEDDIECGSCGSSFDPDNEYRIDGIKCSDCGTLVPLKDASEDGEDTLHICPKCAAIHRLSPSVDKYYETLRTTEDKTEFKLEFAWKAEPKKETKSDKPKREGRSGRGKSTESKALDKKLGKDEIPF